MIRLAQRPKSIKRSTLRVARHFPSLREDLGPGASMFMRDIPLSIMPIRARDAGTYNARIIGTNHEVERATALLQSLTRYARTNLKELVGDAITEIATNVAWYGRAPYEISNRDDVRLTSFTPRRLFVTPWLCVQAVPRTDRESWKEAFILIPRRDLWVVEVPKALGGYHGYRKILRELARFRDTTPKFWMKDLERRQTDSHFNFVEYRREVEIYECRVTRRWGWNRRDFSSRNWTEFALFYRVMTFRWAQATLREHILLELNLLLSQLRIKAKIKVSGLPTPENILGLRSEMVFGNVSYSKAYEMMSI
ncbi:hypothetical protein [Bradyrhizobium sp. AZCC 2289]|uniref:hypothetical protein n=1 Tax=Bradyrhizobium sp. AZCC 2289 TaxID=3117026 RepID=UPI002FEF0C12